MKKVTVGVIVIVIVIAITLMGCGTTTTSQDIMMLQKKYPKAVVYNLSLGNRFIVVDSLGILDVKVSPEGSIYSIIKIK